MPHHKMREVLPIYPDKLFEDETPFATPNFD